jgi:hypothetical protein
MDFWLDNGGIGVRLQEGAKHFSVFQRVQTGLGPPEVIDQIFTWISLLLIICLIFDPGLRKATENLIELLKLKSESKVCYD